MSAETHKLLLARQRSRRPDAPILDDLRKILARDPALDDVIPVVRQRVVELTGTVPTADVSALAARRAFGVRGVYAVVNRLEVVSREPRTDVALRRRVEHRLAAHPAIASESVRVQVDRGRALLEGQVGSAEERWMVVDAAASVRGIRNVHDRLGLERDAGTLSSLATRVRAALSEPPALSDGDYRVSVVEGRVQVELSDPDSLEAALSRAYDAGVSGVVFTTTPERQGMQAPRFLWSDVELREPAPRRSGWRSAEPQ